MNKSVLLATVLVVVACGRLAVAEPSDVSETIPFYSPQAITPSALAGRSLRELALMHSTIEARAGQVFAPWWLHLHFAGQSWYRPTGLDKTKLSRLDRANLKVIEQYERQLPAAELKARLQALVDRHGHAFEQPADRAAFSPDGRYLLATYPEGEVTLWDARSGGLVHQLNRSRGFIQPIRTSAAVGFSMDGKRALAATTGKVLVWDAESGKLVSSFSPGIESGPDDVEIEGAAFSPDGQRALVINWYGRPSLWDVTSGKRLGGIEDGSKLDSAVFLPDGQRALLWGLNWAGVVLLDTRTWKREVRVLADQGIDALTLAPGGDQAVAWQWGTGTVHGFLFDPRAGDARPFDKVPGTASAFSRDGKRLYVGELNGRITVQYLASGQSRELRGPTTQMTVRFEPEDAIDDPGSLAMIRPHGAFKIVFGQDADWSRQLALSPDGKTLVAVGRSLALLDTASGNPVPEWRGHQPWTAEDATEVVLLSKKLGVPIDSRWPTLHHSERGPLDHPALLDRPLTKAQIAGFGHSELFLLQDLIYAYRGRQTKALLGQFGRMPWYKPAPAYSNKKLTKTDRLNLSRITAQLKLLGNRILDDDTDR